MTTVIKIAPHENGSHDNQTMERPIPVPEGWALIPEEMGSPETLENFPFGKIAVEARDGVPTVTSWTPMPMPEAEPEEPVVPLERRVDALEAEAAAVSASIARGLNL